MGIRTIGLLTSGGDAPGMNACIRAIVRSALVKGLKIKAIRRGYQGLLNGDIVDVENRKFVAEIIHEGGTILHTARSKEFTTQEGLMKAAAMCRGHEIDCLISIGGDGTYRGAYDLSNYGIKVLCIPATIDLDVASSDYTIGFDTALTTITDAVGKLRDTSSSHERCSIIEVMGRRSGFLALWCGMAGGADIVIIPEKGEEYNSDLLAQRVLNNKMIGKTHTIMVISEGMGDNIELARQIEEKSGIETRTTILGHIQRGGHPTAYDRVQASMMGGIAIEIAMEERFNRALCFKDGKYIDIDLGEAISMKKEINNTMWDILHLTV